MSDKPSLDGIAIIGMAGRFPKARNVAEFWRNLAQGLEAISFFNDAEIEDDDLRKNPNYVKARGILEDADKFDAAFFGMNPREAEIMDPQHRVFLECAWEALEDAGYDSEREERPIGVFAGMSMNTYLLNNVAANPGILDQAGSYQAMLANDKDYLPTRVSYKLNLRGPSLCVQTACSTSLVAVCVACQQLASYQCDMALAGGVSITFPQKKGHIYQEGGISSPDGHCRAFDERAQGTVAGDGVGIVVLKRLAEAVADRDHIYAVIKGFAINNDGSVKAGYTAPSEDGQAEVIALAQALANIEPETIQYVVTHGTATPLGDPIEIGGLTKAFRAGTEANGFCALTSVKSNIGHLDAAAGVAGLMEAVLALHHREIPPSLHFKRPNPKIDFANSPFFVNTRLRSWKRGASPRRAGVSSFGIGGTNAHVVVEEAPEVVPVSPPQDTPQLFPVSARTATALDQAAGRLASHVKDNPAESLSNIAYTLQVGRRHFPHRRCVVAATREEAVELLSKPGPARVVDHTLGAAFMFPGQGAQHVNMGRELYETWPTYRSVLDECAELLKPAMGEDIRKILFPDADSSEAATRLLQETRVTQPALFVTSYALAQLWIHLGVQPESMIGHSLGEYVCACLADVMNLEDALRVVAARGRLMQEMPTGSMLAVRVSEKELTPLLAEGLSVAALNGPSQCVVSGPASIIEAFEELLKSRDITCQKLRTSHAFHSALMEPMLERFAAVLGEINLSRPSIPFISNVTGTWITREEATDPNYWLRQARHTVCFAAGARELLSSPDRVLLEVGPGQTLTGLARQQAGAEQLVVASLGGGGAEMRAFLAAAGQLWTAGLRLNWDALHGESKPRRVALPPYPFERKQFWIAPARTQQTAMENAPVVVQRGELAESESAKPDQPDCEVKTRLRELFAQCSGLRAEQIRPDATFMEMGFDSLFLTQVSQRIEKAFGVRVAFGQLIERYSTLDLLAGHLRGATPLEGGPEQPVDGQESPGIDVTDRPTDGVMVVPLTEAQREIWFATHRGDEASCVFNETFCVDLKGELNASALESAVHTLVNRHEALRISIGADGESQSIAPVAKVPMARVNLESSKPEEQEARLQAVLDREACRAFELCEGPLVRFQLVRLDAKRHALLVTSHHIVCDGGSINLLVGELGDLYAAYCRGDAAALDEARQFGEFARHQAREVSSTERSLAEQYWIARFQTPPADLQLPADFPRPTVQSFRAGQECLEFSRELAVELKRISAQQGATLFTTLLSAYYVLLHRLSGQEDLVVGVPASGRGTDLSEKLVGHCVNFLPMRVEVDGTASFSDHLALVRRAFVEAYDHQSCTFGSLVQRLALQRTANRMPLLSATFNLERRRGAPGFEGLEAAIRGNHRLFTNFDLTFDVLESNDGLKVDCTYSADLFKPETIRRWLAHFDILLKSVVADSRRRVSELRLLSDADWQQMVVDWNQTALNYPLEACIHDLFEAQAERTPDAVAAVFGRQEITYRELNRRANQLAHHLRSLGAGPDMLIGLCVERSFALLVGVLGVLKAGAAYVPLDWTYPAERLRFMLQDTCTSILVSQQGLLPHVPGSPARVVCLDSDWEALAEHSAENPAKVNGSTNLAYVMYTSGSTGVAKGVGIEHRSAVSFIHWSRNVFSGEELSSVLASTSVCFDLSVFEIFVPLSWGGVVVLAENVIDLPAVTPNHGIKLINTVPSAIKDLLKAAAIPSSVIVVNLAGERLSAQLVDELYRQPAVRKVYDLYGPSEATTYATWALRQPNGPVTIGRPIANTQIYILDAHMQPCPVGVSGEIYIGGDCLARGYINRPELTAERFVPDPFATSAGGRLYKTGDLGRYCPDGTIEFLGRKDHQVKIRGYRVELGEIETVLTQHPSVQECVALMREDTADDRQLVAYLVPRLESRLSATEVRRFLRERLPDYMIPGAFVTLPALPVMPNGKIDRGALPPPALASVLADEDEQVSTLSPVEEALSAIWRDVLGVQRVGLHDDFFDLGGHSVLVTQITSRVRNVFEVELSMRHLFSAPTVSALAKVIEQLLEEQIQNMSQDELRQLTASGREVS
jgi:amino acid adenylation domain-containing protein